VGDRNFYEGRVVIVNELALCAIGFVGKRRTGMALSSNEFEDFSTRSLPFNVVLVESFS
jgi:hypothetical protein